MRPSYTEFSRISPTAPPVLPIGIGEIRNDLGLFDDSSFDDLITEQAVSAEEYISTYLGHPVTRRSITDFWPSVGSRLHLSGNGIDSTNIVLRYHDAENVEQIISGWTYDATSRPYSLVVPSATRTLSTIFMNPVSATYDSGIELSSTGWSAVRQALKFLIAQYFYNRGRQDVTIETRHVKAILAPYRRVVL